MPQGLTFKKSAVKIGGLTLQPLKQPGQQDIAPSPLDPIPAKVTPAGDTGVIANRLTDTLKLQPTRARRGKIIAEKGVSVFRPEIISGIKFVPVYDGEIGRRLASMGEMLDLQMLARNIRVDNINAFIDSLREDDEIAAMLAQLESAYVSQLDQARSDTRFVIDAYTAIDDALQRLDIFNNAKSLRKSMTRSVGENAVLFDIRDIFVDHMGFTDDGFRRFTNTKLFGQMAFDLGNSVRRYTPGLFDIVDDDRPSDIDPLKFDRTVETFGGRLSFDLTDFGRADKTVNAFDTNMFNRFINALPADRDDRLKLLSISISRLLGVSVALGTRSVQADLQRLGVDASIDDPLAEVVGAPGQLIMDEPDGRTSLISLSRIVDTRSGEVALPFEKRYVVDTAGRRFIPGNDYFFDGLVENEGALDITRLVDFNRRLQSRVTYAMNILEAGARVDSPYVDKLFGTHAGSLRGDSVFNRALETAATALNSAQKNDSDAKNFIFILAMFSLSQTDKKLRHLLFQLLAITVIYNDLKRTDTENIELVEDMSENEVTTFGDFPSLKGYEVEIQPEAGVFVLQKVGETTVKSGQTVGTAYRQVQRLVIDRVFEILSRRSHSGYITALKQQAGFNAAKEKLQSFNTRYITRAFNAIGSGGKLTEIQRPDFDQTFDEDFREVLFQIARFADDLEESASHGGGTGRLRRTRHLRDDRSGRSRYLAMSSSTRLMFAFELVSSIWGAYDFAKFGGLDVGGDSAQVIFSVSKMKTFAKAANAAHGRIIKKSSVGFAQTKHIGSLKLPFSLGKLKSGLGDSKVRANADQIDDNLAQSFQNKLDNIRDALVLDTNIIRSMTMNFRSIADQLDQAVDHARVFFGESPKRMTRFEDFKPQRLTRPRRMSKVSSTDAQKVSQLLKLSKGLKIGSIRGISDKSDASKREKHARFALMSRQQAALSFVKMRDIAQYNARFSPIQARMTKATFNAKQGKQSRQQPSDPFVDGSRISTAVQDALWSMLSEPEFRGDDGGVSKILTVGIPAGFADKLEDSDRLQESDYQDARTDRQLDMISVDIFRKDVIEEDIVFKPRQFIFEMSRFVSAFSFENTEDRGPHQPVSFETVLNEQCRMLDVSAFNADDIRGQLGLAFMKDERYEFMPTRARRALLRNHVISFLLSVYVRMLTGMDLREDAFLIEPDAIKDQDDPVTSEIYQQLMRRLVNNAGTDLTLDELRSQFPAFNDLLVAVEEGEFQPGVLETAKIISTINAGLGNILVSDELTDVAKLGSSKSMLTGGERLRRAITSPKLFERIFHVYVDPFDFEIDVEKTNATAAGRLALRRLRIAERLIDTTDSGTGRTVVKLKRVAPNQDVIVDQYFTVISRYEPPGVSQSLFTSLQGSSKVSSKRLLTQLKGKRMTDTSAVKRMTATSKELGAVKKLSISPSLFNIIKK